MVMVDEDRLLMCCMLHEEHMQHATCNIPIPAQSL